MYLFCCHCIDVILIFFFFKQKTAYEMRISDWSSDVCSSDLAAVAERGQRRAGVEQPRRLQLLDTREGVEGFQAEVVEEGLGGAPGDRAARRLAATLGPDQAEPHKRKIGRESWRERVCQYV